MLKPSFFTLLLFLSFTYSFTQDLDRLNYVLDSAYKADPFFANILLKKNNETLLEKSFGYADYIKKTTLSSQNSFQIASVSKQFTAYGIMILKNKGLLAYDSAVTRYLPSFPYKYITVRHLLTHSTGLPRFWEDIRPHLDTTVSNGNKEVLNYLIKHQLPLQFEPGVEYQYSDIGYDFLANIIEQVSGMNFQNFMEANVFKPLKMTDSFAYMVTDIRKIKNKKLAVGHATDIRTGNISHAHLLPKYNLVFYLGNFYGDGSVVTTARDLNKWDNALRECKLLPCSVQNESIIPFSENGQRYVSGEESKINYGFGWRIKTDDKVGKVVYHSGSHPGNRLMFYRLIDKNVTLIYLSNYEKPENNLLINKIISLISE